VLPAVVHHFGHAHGRSPVVATFLSWLLSFGRAPLAAPSTVPIPLQRTPLSPSTVAACCFAALDLSSPVSPCVVTHLTCVCASSSSGGGARSGQKWSAHHRREDGVVLRFSAHRVRR
jgi:hypothetical protein